MNDWIRPLFSFRKNLLAHKILKVIRNPTLWYCDPKTGKADPEHEINQISLSRYSYNNLIKYHFAKSNPLRVLSAIDLLAKNDHVSKMQADSLKEFGIFCTRKGLDAYEEGYYIKRVYIFWGTVIGTPVSLIEILRLTGVL